MEKYYLFCLPMIDYPKAITKIISKALNLESVGSLESLLTIQWTQKAVRNVNQDLPLLLINLTS